MLQGGLSLTVDTVMMLGKLDLLIKLVVIIVVII